MVESWGKRGVTVGSGMRSRNALRLNHLASFPDLSLLPNCICNAARYLMLNLLIPHVTVIMSFPTFHTIECQWPHQQSSRCQLSFGRLAHQEAKYWQALTSECLLLLLCFYVFVGASFLWYLSCWGWVSGDSHCLKCSVVITWKCPVLLCIFAYRLL